MKKFVAMFFCLLLLAPTSAFAQDFTTQLDNTGTQVFGTNSDAGDLIIWIGVLINVLISLLGVVMLILIVYSGFLWMTAGGNKERVTQAQQYILNSVIGLAILLFSYAIANFVLQLLTSTGSGTVAFL